MSPEASFAANAQVILKDEGTCGAQVTAGYEPEEVHPAAGGEAGGGSAEQVDDRPPQRMILVGTR